MNKEKCVACGACTIRKRKKSKNGRIKKTASEKKAEKEKQLMELEKRLQEWITLAKQAGLGTEDIREMLEGLL